MNELFVQLVFFLNLSRNNKNFFHRIKDYPPFYDEISEQYIVDRDCFDVAIG